MDYIIEGFKEALKLIISLDSELLHIVFMSLYVSISAVLISSFINIPIFIFIGLKPFKGERILSRFLNSLMSIPTIIVGLLISLLLARRGPFGSLQLLYTSTAMIIAQTVLVSPLIAALTYERCKHTGRKYGLLGKTLGANKYQICILVIRELKEELFIIIITAFSRAISEVGAVMMVGGNIKNQTRVMTTAIAMFNSMGDYVQAIALGCILLIISLVINFVIHIIVAKD